MNIYSKVEKFLSRFVDGKKLGGDDNIFEMGIANSLFSMQVINFIEREFDIIVENNEIEIDNFKSINAIVEFVENKIS